MIIQVKIIITIAVFALSSISLSAQNLSIKEIDSRDYPLLKASFYLAGADAEPVNSIDISDLKIFENGSEQVVLNVSCADSVQSLSLSSVLSVDISGSMKGKGLELAKAGTELWFDLIDTGKSECAFTTFNQYSYVNNDLTRDTEALRQSLDNLTAEGGTNYTSAFLDPYTGALTVAANGRNKKIVVFLTDGIAEIDTQSVIQYARIINAEIHCLTIDTDM
ncbi:MAG: vWA domain-containing protein, partial [Bacteroidota bacterium]